MLLRPRPFYVCVIGNIASGKTTLTALLARRIPRSVEVPEVFDQNPFLPLYIADPPRWAFANAVRYFYDYVRVYRERTAGRDLAYAFVDAGAATNRGVYGQYLLQEHVMTAAEHGFYETLCDVLGEAFEHPEPDAFISVEAQPDTCMRRMIARGWAYQTEHVQQKYLETLAGYFASFKRTVQAEGKPVLEVDSEALDFTTAEGEAVVTALVERFLGALKQAQT